MCRAIKSDKEQMINREAHSAKCRIKNRKCGVENGKARKDYEQQVALHFGRFSLWAAAAAASLILRIHIYLYNVYVCVSFAFVWLWLWRSMQMYIYIWTYGHILLSCFGGATLLLNIYCYVWNTLVMVVVKTPQQIQGKHLFDYWHWLSRSIAAAATPSDQPVPQGMQVIATLRRQRNDIAWGCFLYTVVAGIVPK